MKLAGLADMVKMAFRKDWIDIGTAEAFAAVPEDRQMAIWQELNGNPRHAEQVRNIIAAAWIDSAHALFDLSSLPELAVSRDLFSDLVLIERNAAPRRRPATGTAAASRAISGAYTVPN